MLPVSADVRQNAGVAAGDAVEVDLEPDTAPRQVAVPPDFAATLDQDGNAERVFDGLSYSKKQWHVLSIEGARTADTRQRRIQSRSTCCATTAPPDWSNTVELSKYKSIA
jgi:uncharacterized protein YdeI (YjbR/CyaY-like superfamily)